MCIRDRAGGTVAIAQQRFSHAGVLPPSHIRVAVIHVEISSTIYIIPVLIITEPHPVSYTHLDVYKRQRFSHHRHFGGTELRSAILL